MSEPVTSQSARNWANISLVWLDEGMWLGGSYALRDRVSVDAFIGILNAIRQQGKFI